MNLINSLGDARQLHSRFMNSMYQTFGIAQCPKEYFISFEPLISLGGLRRDPTRGLRITLNDTLIIEPVDKLQFEQAVCHETAHILHLIGNDWKIGEQANNSACNEPIGSIIADWSVLVFFESIGRRAEDYFQKLSDYAGPARELFEASKSRGAGNSEKVLREVIRQTTSQLYQTAAFYLDRNYLYDDKQLEKEARKLLAK